MSLPNYPSFSLGRSFSVTLGTRAPCYRGRACSALVLVQGCGRRLLPPRVTRGPGAAAGLSLAPQKVGPSLVEARDGRGCVCPPAVCSGQGPSRASPSPGLVQARASPRAAGAGARWLRWSACSLPGGGGEVWEAGTSSPAKSSRSGNFLSKKEKDVAELVASHYFPQFEPSLALGPSAPARALRFNSLRALL